MKLSHLLIENLNVPLLRFAPFFFVPKPSLCLLNSLKIGYERVDLCQEDSLLNKMTTECN
ncbi:hypothetical protein PN36_05785 [Candidatus Thiomargarita nelsonii]|uniref:Uncharacterized protein n=1 Tax=Candidatus Thiomargarita nelsonii TaxID=1003181 RepID=A0A0A6P8A3_9GAMM|nr:hypothetical protein PN36_05785 [Candidatus Thiomargarita nelsonii]